MAALKRKTYLRDFVIKEVPSRLPPSFSLSRSLSLSRVVMAIARAQPIVTLIGTYLYEHQRDTRRVYFNREHLRETEKEKERVPPVLFHHSCYRDLRTVAFIKVTIYGRRL